MKKGLIIFLLLSCCFAVNAQENEFVGSNGCGMCHPAQKEAWVTHGHASMLTPVVDGSIPGSAVTFKLPEGVTWEDISYLVGGATYYARYADANGFIMTGEAAQYSMTGDALTAFYPEIPNHTRQYDCVRCHVVGWKAEGMYENGVKNDRLGIPGAWFENGVGCEACHGPGHHHAAAGPANLRQRQERDEGLFITASISSDLCGQCHKRTQDDKLMVVGGDLIRSRQQYTEMKYNRKTRIKFTCILCHDPHAGVKGGDGMRRSCLTCHTGRFGKEVQIVPMSNLACTDCHMPDACRGAYDSMEGEYHRGDTPSHIFGITTDPDYRLNDGSGYATLDKDGFVRLTVDMTCAACHNSGKAHDMTREEMLQWAARVHPAD